MKGNKLVIAVILALIVCLVLIPTCAFADNDGAVVDDLAYTAENPDNAGGDNPSGAPDGGNGNAAGSGSDDANLNDNGSEDSNGGSNGSIGGSDAGAPGSTEGSSENGDDSDNGEDENQSDPGDKEPAEEESDGSGDVKEEPKEEDGASGGAQLEQPASQPEGSFKVILSYGDKSVELNDLKGGEQNDLAAIVSQLGIEGDIESAYGNADELFSAANEDGWKLVTNKAFGTKQTLTLVVGGVEYTIDVEDDQTVNTIEELVEAVKNCDGGTIKIGADMDFNGKDGVVIPEGKTVTIDLNGKKLSLNRGDNKTIIVNYGTLTIKDSSSEGTGLIESETAGLNPVRNMPGATLIIDGGTLRVINCGGRGALDNRGIATINDGAKLEHEGNPKFNGTSAIINYANDDAVLTINGGTVTRDISARGTIIIKSGTLNGKILSVNSGNDTDVTISGGTFSEIPNKAHLAEGATLVENPDGTCSIIMPEPTPDPKPAEDNKTETSAAAAAIASAPLYAKYLVLEGKGQQWTDGDLEFVLNSNAVVKVLIDGVEVEFTVAEDGTVTIASAVIEALEAGTHEIQFIFADGSCMTTFTK